MDNSFTWVATGSGDWESPANWFDATTGVPASRPPGLSDTATIHDTETGTITVTGAADVTALSVIGDVVLPGDHTVGQLSLEIPINLGRYSSTIGPPVPILIGTVTLGGDVVANSVAIGYAAGSLPDADGLADLGVAQIGQGATLSAQSIALISADLAVDGGVVSAAVGMSLGSVVFAEGDLFEEPLSSGTLDLTNHARAVVADLQVAVGTLSVDASSTLEIGDAGTAQAGTITVDPGAVLSGGLQFSAEAATIQGPVLNNGTIQAFFDLSHIVNNGTIFATNATLTDISGEGQIISGHGVTVASGVQGTLSFGSFGYQFYEPSDFAIALGAGVPIDTSDTPRIANFATDFDPELGQIESNAITLHDVTANAAIYTATGPEIGTLALDFGTLQVASLTLLGSYGSDAFTVTPDEGAGGDDTIVRLAVPCFAAGTCITTPNGQVAVEALSADDEVILGTGGTAPIIWIGHRRVDCRRHPDPKGVWPVRIRRGAFAPDTPGRDLFLSPDHAVFAQDVLIPVKYLIDGDSVQQMPCDSVTYYHLELARHDIVLAEGLAVETYLDTGDRARFGNGGRVVSLHPAFSSLTWEAFGYAPLVVTGPAVVAVRCQIAAQAGRSQAGCPEAGPSGAGRPAERGSHRARDRQSRVMRMQASA